MKSIIAVLAFISCSQAWSVGSDAFTQAEELGAPMKAVHRALQTLQSGQFSKKDVFAILDLSKPSGVKRFFILDLRKGVASAHFAAHGKANGDNFRATSFRGFQNNHDMTPLGPLRTAPAEVMDHYRTIVGRYDGRVYNNEIVSRLEGVTSYNSYINNVPGFAWVIHPNWYVAADFRAHNPGALGRSLGCITLDPAENNQIVNQLAGGALIYVTVGDSPVENYL